MEKRILKILVLFACGALLFSCAGMQTGPVTFEPSQFPADAYVTKVDNFEVIFDGSSSMGWKYNGQEKLAIARAFANSMNQTIPEIGFTAGLRSFGHCQAVSDQNTVLGYGMEPYSTAGLAAAVDNVSCAGGNSPLGDALTAANDDIRPLSGKTAMIIVSDGKDMGNGPVAAAQKLAADFGDNLCIYGVLVGDDPAGRKLLEDVVAASGCGFVSNADDLATADAMADFVEKVFLAPGVRDSDGDGVLDPDDQCPGTPAGVVVDKVGCPLDTDMDGVYDYLDKCPGTPMGAKVNAEGCWLPVIYFDFDMSRIRSDAVPVINEVMTVMGKNPGLKMKLNGHTDTVGSATYNNRLGLKRAKKTKNYMVEQGVDGNRISVEGFGFSMPAASNDTDAGRALNRRVEFQPVR